MKIDLETLSEKVKQAVPSATTRIYLEANQIIVGFTNRPDVEIALLTPYDQMQIKKCQMDETHLIELLMSVRRIANT